MFTGLTRGIYEYSTKGFRELHGLYMILGPVLPDYTTVVLRRLIDWGSAFIRDIIDVSLNTSQRIDGVDSINRSREPSSYARTGIPPPIGQPREEVRGCEEITSAGAFEPSV
jgi:hypothetical protein